MQIKQIKKYKTYFEELQKAVCEKYQKDYLKLISYEVAINLDNAPNEIINSSFDSIVSDFEYETDPIYKEALLRRILNSLQNGRLKEKAQNLLLKYFPNQNKFKDFRINALKYSEQLNDLQLDFLKKALINGTIELRYDASYTLKKHIKNEHVLTFNKELILKCSNPDILAFAINSIITNDLAENEREFLLNSIEVDVPIVQFFLFKHKIFSKKHSQNDLELILPIVNQMPYQLKQEAVNILTVGFSKNDSLKKILIESVVRKHYQGEYTNIIDNEIAWKVLFHSFNEDEDVINLIKSQFENEEFPFSFDRHEMFKHLVYYFKDNNELIPAVEQWLNNRLKKYTHIDPDVAFASIFVHTENAKEKLLQELPKNSFAPHWIVMALLDGWNEDKEIRENLKEYFRTSKKNKTSLSAHLIYRVFDSNEKQEAIKILEEILFDRKLTFRERAIHSLIAIDKVYFETNVLIKLIDELDSLPKDIFSQYYSALEAIIKDFHSNKDVQHYILQRVENDNNLYCISVQYFPQLISNEEKLLKTSIPLSKELRLLIIEAFADLSKLPDKIETVLSNFSIEAEEEVMADMAVCLFNHIKETNVDKIINLSNPLVFARGFDYEVRRSVAFTGYLISKKIDEYFEVEDIESNNKEKSRRLYIFNENYYRKYSSRIMITSLIDNFDYLISSTNKDFDTIVENPKFSKEVEDIWGFFARHSTKSSPTYSHIMEFVSNNPEKIKNDSIISFLNRTNPKSPILKEILLSFINDADGRNGILAGRLLGRNFKHDIQVYEEVKNIRDTWDSGRIIALCSGWPDEPILKAMFDNIVEFQTPVDNYVGYNLKFLFRDVNNLTAFLKNISINVGDMKRYHRFYFVPMIERLKKDTDFCLSIKRMLLSSNSINEKISFYNLLSQVNMIDEDVTTWKNKIKEFKNDFGYDIVSNKTVRLKDILHNYYY